jgi:hypothetical protein
LIRGQNADKYMKHKGVKWRGYLNRMEDIKVAREITDWNPMGISTVGPPWNRW